VFTADERSVVCEALTERARLDPAVAAAALLGSLAAGTGDSWSDIDLALRMADGSDARQVLGSWTDAMYAEHGAVHHVDMWVGRTRYRAFLLESTLQVDISFWPAADFLPTGSPVALLFGALGPDRTSPPSEAPAVDGVAGMAWLYALHVRSSLARQRHWQAIYMLDGMRDQVVALACLRHGLPSAQGRGVDRLPHAFTERLAEVRAAGTAPDELRRAFRATTRMFLDELAESAPDLASRLRRSAKALADLCPDNP
jgi:predicted nucleotidyltransferase